MKLMNKITLLMAVVLVSLMGCKKSETLESSVNNRWAGIVENDLEKAYQYFSPGYKEIESLDGFKLRIATAKINMQWKEGVYKSANCESESHCKVSVSIDYVYTFPRRSMGSSAVQSVVNENWIKVDDKWYMVPAEK